MEPSSIQPSKLSPMASQPSLRRVTIALACLVFIPALTAKTAVFPEESNDTAEGAPLIIGQGEQRLLRIPGLKRYSIGSEILRAKPLPEQIPDAKQLLLLKGTTPGTTDLWVWKSDGQTEHRTVRIEKVTVEDLRPELSKALSQLEETEVILTGHGAVLKGTLFHLKECGKIAALVASFPKEIDDLTEPSPELLRSATQSLTSWLQKSTYGSRLHLEGTDTTLRISGSLDRPDQKDAVERKAKNLYPKVILAIACLPDEDPTIHFKVYLLELKHSKFSQLGLSWPPGQEGAFHVTPFGVDNLLRLDVALQAMEGEGAAKVLSNPELVVRAPGEAELFSGGELPIRSQSRFYSNITWKPYGLTLHLKVTHTTSEKVRLDIMTEASRLDPHASSDSEVPGIFSNRMKTQVDARYGVPLLLSGLLQEGTREQAKGLPLLRNLPVLGPLFGSDDYLSERSELVAILQPELNPPPAPLDQIEHLVPKGPVPPPRDWISPSEERLLRQSSQFPWNVLQ